MKILKCGCCGEAAPGKQHFNQDTGFGLCPRCAPGVNFAMPLNDQCQPGMLVAWHTIADDGEYHGWHVGVLKEWDNGTAIVREDSKEKAV